MLINIHSMRNHIFIFKVEKGIIGIKIKKKRFFTCFFDEN